MLPHKVGPSNERYPITSARYNKLFDMDAIAEKVGYPLYMKPFDGGGWRGVSRVDDRHELHRAYDSSGQSLMHIERPGSLRSFRPQPDDRPADANHVLSAGEADARAL